MSANHPSIALVDVKLIADDSNMSDSTNDTSTLTSQAALTNLDAPPFHKYISDEAFTYAIISVMTVGGGLISIMGVITNVINIIVFVRQGVFSDSATVSLFGLAVADFMSTASMLWISITFCVAILEPPGLNWKPFDFMYMTGAWPHVIAGLITRVVTALIAFERCFCVVFPFKVKNVFTPRCSFTSVMCIFAYFILTYTPVYILNTFQHRVDLETNRSHLVLAEHPQWQYVQVILSYGNLYTLNFGAVIIVLVCTTITISRVKLSSAWRESMAAATTATTTTTITTATTSSGNEISPTFKNQEVVEHEPKNSTDHPDVKQAQAKKSGKLSLSKMQREKKLIRMITLISVIFLICYMPSISLPIIYSYNREIRTDGKYRNLAWTIFSFVWGSETLNSSINIFIYYKMSSRYKKEFDALFGIKQK